MTTKDLNIFLKSLLTARLCDSISDCNEALERINRFAIIHDLVYSEYPKRLQSRYRSLCNKRRNIWNNCLK